MCLVIFKKTKTRPRPKVAQNDIVVYKRLKRNSILNRYVSPFQDFYYPPQKVVTIKKFGLVYDTTYSVWTVNEGLHAYTDKSHAELFTVEESKIFKFIIPKGTKYYTDGYNEIVALAMKRVN